MVADDGELIAGHGRVLAATMLGLKDVPVIRLAHLDEAERRAYRIADNKLTEMGEWDEAMLRDEIAGLLAEDFDLSLLGITDEDLDALLRDPDQVEGGAVEGEDDIPEPPVTPVSVQGDLWQLGSHRLICGDSTSADVIGRLLGDVRPLLMVTDPPYGVEYDPTWRNQAGAAKTKRTGKVLNDDRADWREAWALFLGDVAYVWHGALHSSTVAESLVAAGFAVRSQIIWAKDRLVLSRGDYHWQHKPCWYTVKKTGNQLNTKQYHGIYWHRGSQARDVWIRVRGDFRLDVRGIRDRRYASLICIKVTNAQQCDAWAFIHVSFRGRRSCPA
jgi:hypothetical protein